jgi:hypothetical protein
VTFCFGTYALQRDEQVFAAAGPVRELWVLGENTRGRRFSERHGWRPDGAERETYGVVELAVPARDPDWRSRRAVSSPRER